jgi:ribosome maturation factor RimP
LGMSISIDQVQQIAERVAQDHGLELVDLEYKSGAGKQGKFLRVFIDKAPGSVLPPPCEYPSATGRGETGTPAGNVASTSAPTPSPVVTEEPAQHGSGVTHHDCEVVSRELSTILDVEGFDPGTYTLEVSSPGLDRKLSRATDFQRFTGNRIKVMTREAIGITEKSHGNRHFEGKLEKFENGWLTLRVGGGKKNKKDHSPEGTVEIALDNVERANLVPEI